MSFFRTSKANMLPAASEPPKKTKKRHTIDWQLNPDPVDGQIRQGTKNERIDRETADPAHSGSAASATSALSYFYPVP